MIFYICWGEVYLLVSCRAYYNFFSLVFRIWIFCSTSRLWSSAILRLSNFKSYLSISWAESKNFKKGFLSSSFCMGKLSFSVGERCSFCYNSSSSISTFTFPPVIIKSSPSNSRSSSSFLSIAYSIFFAISLHSSASYFCFKCYISNNRPCKTLL